MCIWIWTKWRKNRPPPTPVCSGASVKHETGEGTTVKKAMHPRHSAKSPPDLVEWFVGVGVTCRRRLLHLHIRPVLVCESMCAQKTTSNGESKLPLRCMATHEITSMTWPARVFLSSLRQLCETGSLVLVIVILFNLPRQWHHLPMSRMLLKVTA